MKPRPVIFDAECLARCVREWQDRLGLADWTIASSIARADDMPRADKEANVWYQWPTKAAILTVRDPIDYPKDETGLFPQDMEDDVVHELLHVKLALWQPSEKSFEDLHQEQVICDLVRAFVRLKRRQ